MNHMNIFMDPPKLACEVSTLYIFVDLAVIKEKLDAAKKAKDAFTEAGNILITLLFMNFAELWRTHS